MGTAIDTTSSLLIMGVSTAIALAVVSFSPIIIPGAVIAVGTIGISLTLDYYVNDVVDIKRRILN